MLRGWIRCKRKAWLDKYGDKKLRVWSPHKTLQLDHQHQSFLELISKPPSIGIQGFQKGSELISGLKLKGKTPFGQSIEAYPALIQKTGGESQWGKFSYRPVITKQGRKLTREHKLSLAFTGLLLSNLQENLVNQGIAISKTDKGLSITKLNITKNLTAELIGILNKLEKDLNTNDPPPLTSNRRKCSICSWRNFCNSEASFQGHLSEVVGIGSKRMEMLQKSGVKNVKELANSNPVLLQKTLENYGEINKTIASQIIKQAFVQSKKIKERLTHENIFPELIEAKGVLIYDIESDPDKKHDFLHGFMRVVKTKGEEWDIKKKSYHPILSLNIEDEKVTWQRLQKKLNTYKNWPILHYGETEALALYRLAERQNAKENELLEIKARCIDIHSRIKEQWRLPVNSYGLKSIASYLDFEWSDKGVDGAQALLWWRQWKNSRRATKTYSRNLKLILNYNRDDCLATWIITNWLLNQK